MSNPGTATEGCTLVVAELFDLINKQRNLLSLTPIENGAIASRCTLRFNVDKQRGLDFSQDKVILAPEDVKALENLVNEQFGCYLDGELQRICVAQRRAAERQRTPLPSEFVSAANVEPEPEKGLMSKFKRIFSND